MGKFPWSIVGNVVSGVASIFNTNSTNKSNRKINRENNAFNAAESQKSRDFTLDMWNRENDYNTPAMQMQRWKDAGVNPYFALGAMDAGMASSADTGQQASASGAAPMQSADFSFMRQAALDVAQIELAESEARKNDADADSTSIGNEYARQMLQLQIDNMLKNGQLTDEQKESVKWSNRLMNDTYDMKIQQESEKTFQAQYDSELKRIEIQSQRVKLDMSVFERDVMNPLRQKQMETDIKTAIIHAVAAAKTANAAMMNARTNAFLAPSQARVNYATAYKECQEALTETEKRYGQRFTNRQLKAAADYYVALYNNGARIQNYKLFQRLEFADELLSNTPVFGQFNRGLSLFKKP